PRGGEDMRRAVITLAPRREHGQHPGLLLQRFLAEPAAGESGNPEEKRRLLGAAVAAARNPEVRVLHRLAHERWLGSLPPITETAELTTAGRLIVGLG